MVSSTENYDLDQKVDKNDLIEILFKYGQSEDSWENLIIILSHFGVKTCNRKLILKWHQEDVVDFTFLLKLTSKLIQKNIIGIYDNQECEWILMER